MLFEVDSGIKLVTCFSPMRGGGVPSSVLEWARVAELSGHGDAI